MSLRDVKLARLGSVTSERESERWLELRFPVKEFFVQHLCCWSHVRPSRLQVSGPVESRAIFTGNE